MAAIRERTFEEALGDASSAEDFPTFNRLIIEKVEEVGYDNFANLINRTRALAEAADIGNLSMINKLLEVGAKIDVCESHYMRTPLTNASYGGHLLAVNILLGNGANVHATDYVGATPLMEACRAGDFPLIVDRLIEAGSELEAINESKETALMIASIHGRPESVKTLLRAGAEVML